MGHMMGAGGMHVLYSAEGELSGNCRRVPVGVAQVLATSANSQKSPSPAIVSRFHSAVIEMLLNDSRSQQ